VEAEGNPEALPTHYDSRQASRFTAAWTLATFAGLNRAGADSAIFYETPAWGSPFRAESGLPTIPTFPAGWEAADPAVELSTAWAGFRHGPPLFETSSDDFTPIFRTQSHLRREVVGICLFDTHGRGHVVLAELTGEGHEVELALGAEISLASLLNGPPVLASRAKVVSCSTGSPRIRPGPFAIAVPEAN